MRRSTRLQLRQQKSQTRLASVPEHENEDGDVAECNNTEHHSAGTSDIIQIQIPAVPSPLTQLALSNTDTSAPPTFHGSGSLPTTTLYTFYTNLDPPPLRRWRRDAWINCPRGGNIQAPDLPPPPPNANGFGAKLKTPAAALGASPLIDKEEEVEDGDQQGKTEEETDRQEHSPSEKDLQGVPSEENIMEAAKARRQLRARHGGGNIRPQASCSQPSIFSYRPVTVSAENSLSAAMRPAPGIAVPPLVGAHGDPPSYTTAVAQQQQLSAMKEYPGELPLTAGLEFSMTAQQPPFIQYSTTIAQPQNQMRIMPIGRKDASKLATHHHHPALLHGQRPYRVDHLPNANKTESCLMSQLKQQVGDTCSTLYGSGENPCGGSTIKEDLASRHSILVQILQSGRPGTMGQYSRPKPPPSAAAGSAGPESDEEQYDDILTSK